MAKHKINGMWIHQNCSNACVIDGDCLCRRFDVHVFQNELKDVLRLAGMEGVPLLLFLEERHLGADPGW